VRVGDAALTIGPLAELTGEYPLVEPLAAALMRALYEVGRGTQALDHYAGLRQRLADELGVDPSAELQRLHRTILRGEPEPPTAAPAAPTPAVPVPAQLPPDVRGFTGRARELDRLDAIMTAAGEQPTAVVISTIAGTAGVGKTTLAVHWAHRVRHRF